MDQRIRDEAVEVIRLDKVNRESRESKLNWGDAILVVSHSKELSLPLKREVLWLGIMHYFVLYTQRKQSDVLLFLISRWVCTRNGGCVLLEDVAEKRYSWYERVLQILLKDLLSGSSDTTATTAVTEAVAAINTREKLELMCLDLDKSRADALLYMVEFADALAKTREGGEEEQKEEEGMELESMISYHRKLYSLGRATPHTQSRLARLTRKQNEPTIKAMRDQLTTMVSGTKGYCMMMCVLFDQLVEGGTLYMSDVEDNEALFRWSNLWHRDVDCTKESFVKALQIADRIRHVIPDTVFDLMYTHPEVILCRFILGLCPATAVTAVTYVIGAADVQSSKDLIRGGWTLLEAMQELTIHRIDPADKMMNVAPLRKRMILTILTEELPAIKTYLTQELPVLIGCPCAVMLVVCSYIPCFM